MGGSMDIALALAVIAIPLWLNVKATFLIARDAVSERRQKVAQLLLVWFIPAAGAVVVLAVHRPVEPASRLYRKPADPGDDFAHSGRAIKRIREVLDGDD
jgi:hypothetical protein